MKVSSRILILLLILCVAFAFAYTAIESVHDCHGEDCPICRIIALLSSLFGGVAVLCSLFVAFYKSERLFEKAPLSTAFVTPVTPVALKVKLSN